jgi:hypothetical protein
MIGRSHWAARSEREQDPIRRSSDSSSERQLLTASAPHWTQIRRRGPVPAQRWGPPRLLHRRQSSSHAEMTARDEQRESCRAPGLPFHSTLKPKRRSGSRAVASHLRIRSQTTGRDSTNPAPWAPRRQHNAWNAITRRALLPCRRSRGEPAPISFLGAPASLFRRARLARAALRLRQGLATCRAGW